MPTVIAYDSPAIMAGLAADVSQARGGQQQFEDSLQQEREAAQLAAAQQPRPANDAGDRATYIPSVPTPAWTEGGPTPGGGQGGPTIYHPAGEQQLAPQAMQAWTNAHAGGLAGPGGAAAATGPSVGSAAGGRSRAGGAGRGGLPMNQQSMLDQIDQMEQQGMLNAAEAMRWRAQVHSGENPFGQKTAAEEQADLHMKQRLTPQQQHAQERQSRMDQDREDREDYKTAYQFHQDAIKELGAELKSEKYDDAAKARIQSEIDGHKSEAKALRDQYLARHRAAQQGPPQAQGASSLGVGGYSPTPVAPGQQVTSQNGVISNAAGVGMQTPPPYLPQGGPAPAQGGGPVGFQGRTIGNAGGMQDQQAAQAGRQPAQSYGLSIDQAMQLRNLYGSGAAARQALQKYGSFEAALAAAERPGS